MMHSLLLVFYSLYDAVNTLYHHIVAIDNKKIKKKKTGSESSRARDFRYTYL
jgi:hypothetical protein